jgi:hypothetical protein
MQNALLVISNLTWLDLLDLTWRRLATGLDFMAHRKLKFRFDFNIRDQDIWVPAGPSLHIWNMFGISKTCNLTWRDIWTSFFSLTNRWMILASCP